MTDPRLARYAELLCGYSLEIGEGHRVVIDAPVAGSPLALAVAREAWRRGADAVLDMRPAFTADRLLREGSDAQLDHESAWKLAVLERADCWLTIWAPVNTASATGIDGNRTARRARARTPLSDLMDVRLASGDLRWVGCAYPTAAAAQNAGMGTAAWERFVLGACLLDEPDPAAAWRAVRDRQERLIERLSRATEARVRAAGTDLTVRIAGVAWEAACGRENMPDGEVFCCPDTSATAGTITFDVPSFEYGRRFEGVRLTFRDGRVVEARARVGEAALHELLDTDEGARRLGEFAIATNTRILHPVGDTLFDEKIGGTCHVALGRAFPEIGGTNTSGIHWDLICDLRRGGSIEVDGEVVLRDGELMT